jgi:deoxyribonuclease-4
MLIGAHVSTAGGLSKAIERGVERGCEAIQIFNQSPRMWRPTRYGADDYAEFREAMAVSPISSVVIHAIYLINCAAPDGELRAKSLQSLVHALRVGDEIGADGVVLHPGSLAGNPQPEAMKRVGKAVAHALGESERCPLLLENTAGHTGTLGRDFGELAELVELGGAHERLGVCLDSCHLLASGHEVRDAESLTAVMADFGKRVGWKRLRCLHVNDSKTPLGSNRDRHENLGDGELGAKGIATFLSEPRFEKLPAILEVPGPDKKGPDKEQVSKAKRLRNQGLKRRG